MTDTEKFKFLILDDQEPKKVVLHEWWPEEKINEVLEQERQKNRAKNETETQNYYKSYNSDQKLRALFFDYDYHGKTDEHTIPVQQEKILKIIEQAKKDNISIKINFTGRGHAIIFPVKEFDIAGQDHKKTDAEIYKPAWDFVYNKLTTEFDVKLDKSTKDIFRCERIPGTYNTTGNAKCRTLFEQNGNTLDLQQILNELPKKTTESEVSQIGEKAKIILTFEKKLQTLLESKKLDGYESRSEKEMAIVNRLAQYGLIFEEVDSIMKQYKSDKWLESPEAYRKLTYEKALEFSSKKQKPPLIEYLTLPVKKINLYPNKKNSVISIIIGNTTIDLKTEEILNANAFRSMYFSHNGNLLSPIKPEIWCKLCNIWTKQYGEIKNERETDESTLIPEKILDELETFTLLKDKGISVRYGRAYYDPLISDSVEIPSFAIEKIIEKNKWKVNLTQVSSWMDTYLNRSSKRIRVGKQLHRFWCFKKETLGFDYEDAKEPEKEEG